MKQFHAIAALLLVLLPSFSLASDPALTIGTVSRAPFSIVKDGKETGFSIELWEALAKDIDRDYTLARFDSFSEMLDAVKTGQVDAAVANISITSAREKDMDFSQPIFSGGLQIMTHTSRSGGASLFSAVFSRDLLLAIGIAFALLVGGGMLMWRMERNSQPYFERPAKDAVFPSFWWALNLVVNGGFEERVPRTPLGRIFAVILVISSLFIVSAFTARITSVMTVEAISSSISSLNDLHGKNVGTIQGSTAESYLKRRDLHHTGYKDLDEMLAAFEEKHLDAVVFDAPILAYYANTRGRGEATMAGQVFLRENYGIAMPTDSPLIEEINQSLLKLRENGTFESIRYHWFGSDAN